VCCLVAWLSDGMAAWLHGCLQWHRKAIWAGFHNDRPLRFLLLLGIWMSIVTALFCFVFILYGAKNKVCFDNIAGTLLNRPRSNMNINHTTILNKLIHTLHALKNFPYLFSTF
jgi:hypothetical protein